jgi:hypothetical protein
MFVYGVTCISTVHLVVCDGIWSTLLCTLDYFLFIGFGVLCSVWHCYTIFLTCCSSCGSGGVMAHVTDCQTSCWIGGSNNTDDVLLLFFFSNLFDYFQRWVPCRIWKSLVYCLWNHSMFWSYIQNIFFVCIDLDHTRDGLKKDSME